MDAPAAPVRSRGARWAPRRSHRVVALDDASLVMVGGFASGAGGGSSAEVWTAARDDDDAWFWRLAVARAPFGPRDGHAVAVAADGAALVIGGATADALTAHDVWRSADGGATWTLATATPGWAGRTHHEAVALGDAVFVLGGFGEFGYCDDCWASRDGGGTWERRTAAAAWGPRAMHAACGFRGALYVAGGYDGRECRGDVWASVDGARWSRLCHRAPWVPRRGHAVVAAGACLALVGGEGGGGAGESLGDCWTSADPRRAARSPRATGRCARRRRRRVVGARGVRPDAGPRARGGRRPRRRAARPRLRRRDA